MKSSSEYKNYQPVPEQVLPRLFKLADVGTCLDGGRGYVGDVPCHFAPLSEMTVSNQLKRDDKNPSISLIEITHKGNQ